MKVSIADSAVDILQTSLESHIDLYMHFDILFYVFSSKRQNLLAAVADPPKNGQHKNYFVEPVDPRALSSFIMQALPGGPEGPLESLTKTLGRSNQNKKSEKSSATTRETDNRFKN